ncbi:type II secretion system protein N [Marinobacter sp. X15-166B]|uniref:type II secretion system protein N n=1 Tax=Marinobacter sp. X15-166B TaxID=1897620 RepID=UPI00085C5697|nr:type II secretion system protein N [Marinobacter sp. X15-166B]OEY65120.1 general secretion pathway protein GspC [Marinobacter sp. X15-166B]
MARVTANVLLVLMVVYLAVTAARITWYLVWPQQPMAPSGPEVASGSRGDAGLLRQPLAAYSLFGQAEGVQPIADTVRRNAPETRLKLRLEGVLVAEHAAESGAIVAGSDGVTEHYRVGQRLPGNAELMEVEPHRILLQRNGVFETLTFEDAGKNFAGTVEPATMPAPPSPDAFIESARQQLDQQGVQALAAFGLRPAEGEAVSGYVYDGSNALLRAVNLQAGDVITAINGQPLGDLEQDRALLESWRAQPQLEIEIVRDGARFTVNYALPQQWR